MTYRINRSGTPDSVVFILSGEMEIEHVTRLQEFIVEEAHDRITLDLKDITIADRVAVRFLAEAESRGIQVTNCPEYVRSWIAAEKRLETEAPS